METILIKNEPGKSNIILKPKNSFQYVLLLDTTVVSDIPVRTSEFTLEIVFEKPDINVDLVVPNVLVDRENFLLKVVLNHKVKNTGVNVNVKSVLLESSQFNFEGLIKVCGEGSGTKSSMYNKVLLFGDSVQNVSEPALEINSSDVNIFHGSTSGGFDKDLFFYLASRGFTEEEAYVILKEAFLEDLLHKINNERIRNKVKKVIYDKLQKN